MGRMGRMGRMETKRTMDWTMDWTKAIRSLVAVDWTSVSSEDSSGEALAIDARTALLKATDHQPPGRCRRESVSLRRENSEIIEARPL
jgi:hypothetical protein